MKKTVEKYFCDYCGDACEHTPEFVLPAEIPLKAYDKSGNLIADLGCKNGSVQRDICPTCQRKISKILKLLNQKPIYFSVDGRVHQF